MGSLKYLGSMRVKKVYGGWVKGIEDPETVGIHIDKENAEILINYLVKYLRHDDKTPIVLTVYRKKEDTEGFRTTVNIPY